MGLGKLAAYALLVLFAASSLVLLIQPVAYSATAFKSVEPGKKWQGAAGQGWCTWSKYLYHQGFSKNATGGILDFSNVKLGSTGYVMPRLGFCSDTAAVNMTITNIGQQYMTYTVTGAGFQRIWCPDRGEPYDVEGDSGISWDPVNQVLTVATSGAASVKVIWYGPSSGEMWNTVKMIMSLFPLLILLSIVGAIRVPEQRMFFIQLAVVAGIILFFANFLAGMGV